MRSIHQTEIMSEINSPSLLTLPVELLHRIFDYLDAQTILLSFSYVCTHLRAVTHTYEKYTLDLTSISKSDFHHMCSHSFEKCYRT